jgi:Protein of unknown function (DUF3800)
LKWFADNSELNGIKDAEIPDILIFGGIVVPARIEHELRLRIESIKGKYAHPRAPVKWNMRDLKQLYEKQNQGQMQKTLQESSRAWRQEIFSALAEYDVVLVLSCIEAYSTDRKKIIENKEELTKHSFSNGLMRFGLHVQTCKPDHAQVILDWPDRNESRPFDAEYRSAFNRGFNAAGKVTYHCGPLSNLRFLDSVTYANMHHSTLLQAADLVVGAVRELVECCLGKKKPGQGVDCARIVRDKFRGAPTQIYGHGISVSSGNRTFSETVRKSLFELLYPRV